VRLTLTRLEVYVLQRTMLSVLGALAVLGTVVMLIDFVEISRDVGVNAEIGAGRVFGLTLLKSPAVLLLLLPFVFLFGTLAAFVGLNRRSELIAMRAAGVSAWRFIFPAAAAAFAVGVLTVAVLNPGATALNAKFEQTRDALTQGKSATAPKEVWLRQGGRGRTQIVIHALSRSEGEQVVLKGVSLFIYEIDKAGALHFTRRIDAAEARLAQGEWRLTGVREAGAGETAQVSESMSIPSTVTDAQALSRFTSPNTIPFWSLPSVIERTEQAGLAATAYRLRLQQLLAMPVLFAAMSVLAAAFCLRLVRLGGLAGLAGSGVALGFAFFFFNELCGALGRADIVPPFAAAWTPPVLALLSGLTLLCYTEDG
jgi:lipopolysaccharide export system permease protein